MEVFICFGFSVTLGEVEAIQEREILLDHSGSIRERKRQRNILSMFVRAYKTDTTSVKYEEEFAHQ